MHFQNPSKKERRSPATLWKLFLFFVGFVLIQLLLHKPDSHDKYPDNHDKYDENQDFFGDNSNYAYNRFDKL